MNIRVFQSDKGDCLLLTGADGKRLLADGGMVGSYRKHAAPFLGKLREQGAALDLVYVSHIDQDHISGVLAMMDDAVKWRVHDFQIAHANPDRPKPRVPRPPEVRAVWHNAFHEQLSKNAGPIEEMLTAEASLLTLRNESWARAASRKYADLAASNAEAVRLSRRIGDKQLGIPLNAEYGGGLMIVSDPPDPILLGAMSITVIGPFEEDLRVLRKKWNAWLRSKKGKKQILKIKAAAREDERNLGVAEIDRLFAPLLAQAEELGDRNKVTAPNLASLMLLVEEENGASALMTGDGHWADILAGLDSCNKLDGAGRIHVDVLKVQHHGSEHNWSAEFGRRVTADHYIFCGNGSDENPDERVVEGIIDSRIGPAAKRSKNAQVNDPFKLWFNSSSKVAGKTERKSHMKKLEELVAERAGHSHGRMSAKFIKVGSSFVIDL